MGLVHRYWSLDFVISFVTDNLAPEVEGLGGSLKPRSAHLASYVRLATSVPVCQIGRGKIPYYPSLEVFHFPLFIGRHLRSTQLSVSLVGFVLDAMYDTSRSLEIEFESRTRRLC